MLTRKTELLLSFQSCCLAKSRCSFFKSALGLILSRLITSTVAKSKF
ncbi:hypothetical protein BAZSYMB_GCONTIG00655_2 [Bathymodiolus azoricus thioautotrophic gill symbiont]|uniref:Uncharacterized protein n=1 Tax=Bathymodiolus azoricus thioautotrophic gill symbiont TaxID=235205 RepID=A0A1H6LJ93_9GAMM|nr:hypothetical protein BAZSYMB_GCONTIG00655_2 [Bathymodiolus azoricus thioautotrophic gill symbiont]